MGAAITKPRLAYIDWMRGLACVLMFQTHAYDAWLSDAARKSTFFMYSQILGTLPAPLFLFLAGISFALVTDKLRGRGVDPDEIAKTTIRRGAEIFGLGILFRLQQFAFSAPWAPWTDLFRVDILNTIGVSMMMMGAACRLAAGSSSHVSFANVGHQNVGHRSVGHRRVKTVLTAVAIAFGISLLTPPLWTTWRPRWLPWPLESYVNGIHTYKAPPGWLFPVFPWAGFAFIGLAVGFVLLSDWARRREGMSIAIVGVGGAATIEFARWLTLQPNRLYAVDDYWRTSPSFFLVRVGMLMAILLGSYAWCRWGAAQWGFSPVIQLGQASLLVYWVHIELVYGKLSILPKKAVSIPVASAALLLIAVLMTLLAALRTRAKGRAVEMRALLGRALNPVEERPTSA
jgi:uncharacterized membrane protein